MKRAFVFAFYVLFQTILGPDGLSQVARGTSIRTSELVTMTRAGDTVLLGGSIREPLPTGSGVLVMLKGNKTVTKRLDFVPAVDELFFVNELTGWMISYGKGVFSTHDGGETWQPYDIARDAHRPLFFVNETVGWYFAMDGSLTSIDGEGLTKRVARFPATSHVKKVQFLNSTHVWLLRLDDGMARFQGSQDGGITWLDALPNRAIRDFQFVNIESGFVLSENDLLWTNTAGDAWSALKIPVDASELDRVFFLSPDTGWVQGRKLCSTSNAGITWRCNGLGPVRASGPVKDLLFVTSKDGWILTDSQVFRTKDGGVSWKPLTIKIR